MKPPNSQQGKRGVPANEQMDEAKRRPDDRPDDEYFGKWFQFRQQAGNIIPALQLINHLEKSFVILRFFTVKTAGNQTPLCHRTASLRE